MIITILVLAGLCVGSFINALVWRLHEQSLAKSKKQKAKYSIARGRSMCVNCQHQLSAKDLLPVASWLWLLGRCRYCRQPISIQYPLVELATALLFVTSYIFWPSMLHSPYSVLHFCLWLVLLSGLMALLVYDLRWMLLPNRLIYPLYIVAFAWIMIDALLLQGGLTAITGAFWGILVGGGLFYIFFQVSEGRWIGGGDVKLGFLLGAIVGGPLKSLLIIFIASLLGTAVTLPLLLAGRAKKGSHIPFGPFLIVAAIIVQLWGSAVIHWYMHRLLLLG